MEVQDKAYTHTNTVNPPASSELSETLIKPALAHVVLYAHWGMTECPFLGQVSLFVSVPVAFSHLVDSFEGVQE